MLQLLPQALDTKTDPPYITVVLGMGVQPPLQPQSRAAFWGFRGLPKEAGFGVLGRS